VRLEPPGPRFRRELQELAGVEVGEQRARAAFREEIAYYVAHHLEGRDAASLGGLRDRCAGVLAAALGLSPAPSIRVVREAMLRSLRFTAYPDASPALASLRRRGLRVVVASNWDCSLPGTLERAGLAGLVDAVVPSAIVGAPKPAAALFDAALRAVGCDAAGAVHVGDSLEHDVIGARAAGIRAVLIARDDSAAAREGIAGTSAPPADGVSGTSTRPPDGVSQTSSWPPDGVSQTSSWPPDVASGTSTRPPDGVSVIRTLTELSSVL